MPPPSACPRVVALAAPLCRPRANIHRLFAPRVTPKSTHFGTSQKSTRGWQRRPLAALWPPMAPFCILFGSILGAIFHHFSILFRTPQNLFFAIPYSVFEGFSNLKALILGPLFDHFFDPILGPPSEEPFGPPWPPKVPTLPPHVDFGPFLGSPLDPKWALGATRCAQRVSKWQLPD